MAEPLTPSQIDAVLQLSDEELLKVCELDFIRTGGPGGQKRNRTSSAVRLYHSQTGMTALASESRSQHENRKRAIRRMRWKIALEAPRFIEEGNYQPSDVWVEMVSKDGQIHFGPKDARYPMLAAHLLDLLSVSKGRLSEAANLVGLSTGQFSRLLTRHEDLLTAANRIRRGYDLHPLRGR
ncbi:MAG: peptide chain release factor-like protein [Planctomycetota bacterium]|nr:peptide chain release factor-like protein [Planctomycetota bacterium]